MKKSILICFFFAFFSNLALCAEDMQVYVPFSNGTAVASTTTIESTSIPLVPYKQFGFWIKATSVSGTPKIRVYYKVAPFDVPGLFGVPDRAKNIFDEISDENIHIEAFSPPPMHSVKIFVEGLSGNPADTLIYGILCLQ